jgi:hypothetical protein
MAKWYAGMVLTIIVIIGIFISMIYYPWFTITTEYPDTKAVGEVEISFYLKEYEVKTSEDAVFLDPAYPPLVEGTYAIEDEPLEGGWDGDYGQASLTGRPAQLTVYKNTYLLLILTIIMAIATVALIPLAGLGKIPVKAALAMAIVMTIFAILGPIYYGVFMPIAFDEDITEIYNETEDAFRSVDETSNITKPEKLQSIWGDSNNIDVYRQVGVDGAQSHWRPGLGWWIGIVIIFMAIISIGMIDGPKRGKAKDRYGDDAYGDRREDWDRSPDYDDRRGPPPRGRDQYDDGYPPRRDYDDYDRRPPPRDDYDRRPPPGDYYDRRPPPPPGGQGGRPPPPPGAPGGIEPRGAGDDYYQRPPQRPPQYRP